MPKRTDIRKILVIGSGPIVIGQACEFDYSGTQACKVLRDEGYEIVLVNSNPATIMTDPEFADRTYVEPLVPEILEKVIAAERPDAILPTLGGQTALNLAMDLADSGVLERYGVEMLGADARTIKVAEDRQLFKEAMARIGLDLPRSAYCKSAADSIAFSEELGFPLVVRPSFTLGGSGGGIAYNIEELKEMVAYGVSLSPVGEVLVEESIIGWKEFELEVMRDKADNVVIVCSIENFDAMGVHTGDSITVAPAQTLTDVEYQRLRDASVAIIREIGVETGGSNIQFALNPENGRLVIIEMNPRVSRSSALASKATGFPIAKIAAKLAVGYTLDEIPNDITQKTPASFEPTIDYVVVKIPRWAFEKFPRADQTLTTKMKSVGETMAIGRTFKEAFQKAIRSLELGRYGFGADGKDDIDHGDEIRINRLSVPNPERIWYIRDALARGMEIEELYRLTHIDPWFLDQLAEIVEAEQEIVGKTLEEMTPSEIKELKRLGYSDVQLAQILGSTEDEVRARRIADGTSATFLSVDTCAAEFEAYTPYYYSAYETESEVKQSDASKVMILGSGPNRIGQGIEFDYCCVHASFALREEGFESIMVNCNPETVSTDYDTSDRLYFEPLVHEDVMNIIEAERPDGVIVQFGGQTPLKLANRLEKSGVKILGTSTDSIDLAEDRKRFGELIDTLGISQAPGGTATSVEEALAVARRIGFPVLVRPSYVLGGRAMEIVYSESSLEHYMQTAVSASPDHPVLVDRFLEDAIEVDVDAIFDGETLLIGGIMEHIEEAGIHSGDSACVLPPHTLPPAQINRIRVYTARLARALTVRGLLNIQFAVKGSDIYVLEVNPRASRTTPFVSKATGIPMAKIAAKVMMGRKLADLGVLDGRIVTLSGNGDASGPQDMALGMVVADAMVTMGDHIAIKEAVLPFVKFPEEDIVLGPEMKSTGEVMGIDTDFGRAFAKAEMSAGAGLPSQGTCFISVPDRDKPAMIPVARKLVQLGLSLVATRGTAAAIEKEGIPVRSIPKVQEGRPNVLDMIKDGAISLVINTPMGRGPRTDGYQIRSAAVIYGIPCITTASGAQAAIAGMEAIAQNELTVTCLQEYHGIEQRARVEV